MVSSFCPTAKSSGEKIGARFFVCINLVVFKDIPAKTWQARKTAWLRTVGFKYTPPNNVLFYIMMRIIVKMIRSPQSSLGKQLVSAQRLGSELFDRTSSCLSVSRVPATWGFPKSGLLFWCHYDKGLWHTRVHIGSPYFGKLSFVANEALWLVSLLPCFSFCLCL